MFPGALIVIVPEPALIVVPAFIAIAPTASPAPKFAVTVTLPVVEVTSPAAVKLTSSPPRSVMSPALLVTTFASARLLPLPVAASVIRSEERRVGKEGRSRWPRPADYTKSAPAAVRAMLAARDTAWACAGRGIDR